MAGPAPAPLLKRAPTRVTILDEYAVVHQWLNEKVASGEMKQGEAQERMKSYESNAKSWASPLKDGYGNAKLIIKLSKDMKTWLGRVYFKTYNGVDYVIIKGSPRLRSIITGTRYKTTHPKMVEFQIGKAGLKGAAKESFVFGAVLVTAIDIADFFMRDSATIGELCGNVGMDVGKVALASLAGWGAGALVAGTVVGTFALGPLVIAFAVGVVAGIVLDRLDEHFHLTDKLSKLLDEGFAKIDKLAHEKGAEFEAWVQRMEHTRTAVDLRRDLDEVWKSVKLNAGSMSYAAMF